MAVSGFAESLAVTRVTPSMSFMAATRRATSSWLRPQPVSTSAGPGIDSRSPPSSPAPSPTSTSGVTVPVRLTSQMWLGITFESSRSTRSQSKRLCASCSTVWTRESWICLKVTNEERPSARASSSVACASIRVASASRSETFLLKTTIPQTAASATASTPTMM